MKRTTIVILLFVSILTSTRAYAGDDEDVTFYPTYGYRDGEDWVIPIRLWVHEPRALVEALAAKAAARLGDLNAEELANFKSRIQGFLVDSESREAVTFTFDNDPENHVYGCPNDFPKTDLNGLVDNVVIKLPIDKADDLLRLQNAQDGWLTFRATSKGHSGTGRVRLIGPAGLSVVSDIDDTIKITDIPAGAEVVIKNTFFRDFAAAPGMAERYEAWQGAAFHYVSGSPWQLYGPLSDFLADEGFPQGTFHMKHVSKNLLSGDTWRNLKELVTNENATFDQKVSQIAEIMERFPKRQFILVGDSGEKDPEVYQAIKERFPDQAQEIIIRDVVNDRERNPGRLEGMEVIDAEANRGGVKGTPVRASGGNNSGEGQ